MPVQLCNSGFFCPSLGWSQRSACSLVLSDTWDVSGVYWVRKAIENADSSIA